MNELLFSAWWIGFVFGILIGACGMLAMIRYIWADDPNWLSHLLDRKLARNAQKVIDKADHSDPA